MLADPAAFLVGSEMWNAYVPVPGEAAGASPAPVVDTTPPARAHLPQAAPAELPADADDFGLALLVGAADLACPCALAESLDDTALPLPSDEVAIVFADYCEHAHLAELTFELALKDCGIDWSLYPADTLNGMRTEFRRRKNRVFAMHSRRKREARVEDLEERQRVLLLETKVLAVQVFLLVFFVCCVVCVVGTEPFFVTCSCRAWKTRTGGCESCAGRFRCNAVIYEFKNGPFSCFIMTKYKKPKHGVHHAKTAPIHTTPAAETTDTIRSSKSIQKSGIFHGLSP